LATNETVSRVSLENDPMNIKGTLDSEVSQSYQILSAKEFLQKRVQKMKKTESMPKIRRK